MHFHEYGALHWTTFLTAALLLNISPGPDIAYIIGRTTQAGIRAGFAAMLGIWTGTLAHIGLTAVGMAGVLAAAPLLLDVVQVLGACFLIWIGLKAVLLSFKTGNAEVERESGLASSFKDGVLVSLLNPKVALFFLAFLPQFVVEGAGPAPLQLAFHGILIIAVAAVVEPPIIIAVAFLAVPARRSQKLATWLDRSFGAVFVTLGAGMLFSLASKS